MINTQKESKTLINKISQTLVLLSLSFLLSTTVITGAFASDTLTDYVVTFDSNGGSAVASQTVSENKAAQKPSDPIRQGYSFGGWQIKDTNKMYNFNSPVTKGTVLVAKWVEVNTANTTDVTNTINDYNFVPPKSVSPEGVEAVLATENNEEIVIEDNEMPKASGEDLITESFSQPQRIGNIALPVNLFAAAVVAFGVAYAVGSSVSKKRSLNKNKHK